LLNHLQRVSTDAPTDVITDTSTLVNFLRINCVDSLAGLTSYRFVVTDHVRAEVMTFSPARLANLEFALMAGHIVEVTLDTPAELGVFGELKTLRLGDGECASSAAALSRGTPLAIDDMRARKKALEREPGLRRLDTVGLVVEAIRAGLQTVPEADAIKANWEQNHRFIKKHFSSFAELVP
jgi:predicted nucleic acid-binding protein